MEEKKYRADQLKQKRDQAMQKYQMQIKQIEDRSAKEYQKHIQELKHKMQQSATIQNEY